MSANRSWTRVVVAAALTSAGQLCYAGQTCDDNGGNSPYVCVAWSQAPAPQPGIHFNFDFQTDPDKPGVEFITGDSAWVVWSQVSDTNTNPAALGDVTIDASVLTDDFSVTIAQSATVAGASSVESLHLKDPNPNWTGFSSIAGGEITGDLNGDLIAVYDGNDGGAASLTIGGDMIGDVDIHSVATGGITIDGDFGESGTTHSIQIVNIEDGDFIITGDAIRADIDVTGELDSRTLRIGGAADSGGGTQTTLLVDDLLGAATIQIGYALTQRTVSDVHVTIGTDGGEDIPVAATVDMSNILIDDGVSVGAHGGDIVGTLVLGGIEDEGQVLLGGIVGTFEIKEGVKAPATPGGLAIDLTAENTGTLKINTAETDSSFEGWLDSNYGLSSTAIVRIYDNGQGGYGHLKGKMSFNSEGFASGVQFVVEGNLHGTTTSAAGNLICAGDMNGDIAVGGSLVNGAKIIVDASGNAAASGGDIAVSGDVDDSQISIDDDFEGDLSVAGDVDDGAAIVVLSLAANGRVLIDGVCDASVEVEKATESNSLIRMTEGLDDNGTILINSSEGDYDANGDIQVGPDDDTSTDPVVFDGCIRIYDNDDTPVPDHGDLDGDMTVNGCHATADDLNITVEGALNGTIDINQATCQNQVSWTSGSCP